MNITVNILGVDFDIEFDYQPEERMVRHYADGSGYPGCAASIDGISKIEYEGYDWYDIFEGKFNIVEDAIWEALANEKI